MAQCCLLGRAPRRAYLFSTTNVGADAKRDLTTDNTDSTDKEVLWQAPFGQEKHTCRVGEREPRIDTNGRECFGR